MQLIQHRETGGGQDWTLTLGFPDARFAPYVLQYWEIQGTFAHSREHVLPMGDLALMINLGPDQRLVDRDDLDRAETFNDAWISGLQHQHLITESPRGSWLCGVRLRPEGAFRMRLGGGQLAEHVVDLCEVLGRDAVRLADRMRAASDAAARFELLEELITGRLADGEAWGSEMRWAMRQLGVSSGGVPVGWLAAELGWSRQRFHAAFVDAVGFAPKVFARVLRFQEAIRVIGTDTRPDLATVAQSAGYYDQAHFNRDFRAFAGLTPGDYLRSRAEGPDLGFAKLN